MKFAAALVASGLCCFAVGAQSPPIEGIESVVFRVSRLPESLHFYRDLLGLPVVLESRDDGGKTTAVRLQVNKRQFVEIVPDLPASENVRLGEIRFEVNELKSLPQPQHFIGPDTQPMAFVKTREEPHPEGPNRISQHLLHAGIVVQRASLDEALHFYTQSLGFREFWRGGPEGAREAWVNLRTEGSRGDYVELMIADGEPDRKRLGSMQHICLEVADIREAERTVRARDEGHTQAATPKVGRNRKWQLNLFDPDGSRVELMEPQEAVEQAAPKTR